MQIKRYINDKGEFRCFAVDNSQLSRKGFTKMLAALPGVTITKWPKYWTEETFCEFTYQGEPFQVMEPYGDNPTYDVVAEGDCKPLESLACHIENSIPIKETDWGYNTFSILRALLIGLIVVGTFQAVIF